MKHACMAILMAGSITLVGCTTVNTVASDSGEPGYNSVPTRKIITDGSLRSKARVVDIRESRVGNDHLKIQAEILNTTSSRKSFNYRIDWLNADGMSIPSLMTKWKTKSIAGKETAFVTAVAPTSKAADFRLQLVETK
ncbi:YcfL family protein [Poriferisphaera sp. WC338]|uniref:YcfL family protein n=1 Tax=Poriferisphaera sp. WC338 TaxID=3425129 RepID=UPI003D81B23E